MCISDRVSDEESFLMARYVSETEGILIGGSGGTAVAAALKVAKEADDDAVIVVLNPDSGRGYLSTAVSYAQLTLPTRYAVQSPVAAS